MIMVEFFRTVCVPTRPSFRVHEPLGGSLSRLLSLWPTLSTEGGEQTGNLLLSQGMVRPFLG